MTHLMLLVRIQVARMTSQRKAVKWSAKAKKAAANLVMHMAAFEWAGNNKVLEAARFLDVYQRNNAAAKRVRFNYTPVMDSLSKDMSAYIRENCVKQPASSETNAIEIKVPYNKGLIEATSSVDIGSKDFKTMFNESLSKMNETFDGLPTTMSLERWNDIMNFILQNDDTDKEDQPNDEYEIYHITV